MGLGSFGSIVWGKVIGCEFRILAISTHTRTKLLTTFITPCRRYYFNKLPVRICSAAEHFQKRKSRILEGLEGVICQMDKEKHEKWLLAVLNTIQDARVTLNREM